ncbi:hypothetical protein LOAG_09175 [Loa loa]|uniref:Uncharacterized protein n=1 Tax=Loa loa TaxID=7209 RepID=A0A1S0TSY4_LOALO|nr:hypothetical protein LOAG_09175 [Loa loa]EFO19319.1 hypothetical protein LOAG_09175 [Loa loa]
MGIRWIFRHDYSTVIYKKVPFFFGFPLIGIRATAAVVIAKAFVQQHRTDLLGYKVPEFQLTRTKMKPSTKESQLKTIFLSSSFPLRSSNSDYDAKKIGS